MKQYIEDLKFITLGGKKNIIIFVHGLTGGAETWLQKNGEKSILEYLNNNPEISSYYDIAIFDYFSKITDLLEVPKRVFARIFNQKTRPRINLSINDLSDILETEIRIKCKKYEKIVLVAHSMGGLICKNYIINEIENKRPLKIELFISLAVPHQGSQLANMGDAIVKNAQLSNLKVLSPLTDLLTRKWVQKAKDVPPTVYFVGKEDKVVTEESAKAIEANNVIVNFTNDNHRSIICPKSENSATVISIVDECLKLIREPGKNEDPQLVEELPHKDRVISLSMDFDSTANEFHISSSEQDINLFVDQLLYFVNNTKDYQIYLEFDKERKYRQTLKDLQNGTPDAETKRDRFELEKKLDHYKAFKELFIERIKILFSLNNGPFYISDDGTTYSKILKRMATCYKIGYVGVYFSFRQPISKILSTKLAGYYPVNETIDVAFNIYLSKEEMNHVYENNGQISDYSLFYSSLMYRKNYFLCDFFSAEFLNDRVVLPLIDAIDEITKKHPELLHAATYWKNLSNYYVGLD